jgi:hypothetical protein
LAIGTSNGAADERRRDARRIVSYRATIQIGVAGLSGIVVDLSHGGACLTVVGQAAARVGQWGVLTGEGPLGTGFGARLTGISGRRWHIAFDPMPLWGDGPELCLAAPEIDASGILRARAQLWRGLVDDQNQDAGRAMTATAVGLEARADRLQAAASGAAISPDPASAPSSRA